MPLRPARVARRGVIGRPVARTAAVVGTAAVVSHGVNRRQDRRHGAGATAAKTGAVANPRSRLANRLPAARRLRPPSVTWSEPLDSGDLVSDVSVACGAAPRRSASPVVER